MENALLEEEENDVRPVFPNAPARIILEDHHNVPRSRGGSGKRVNLSPVDPDLHDRYHELTRNALPSETLRFLATDAVGYGRNRTIAPFQLRAIFDIAHAEDWSEIYKGKAVVPSGTVESFEHHPSKFYLHATRHQIAELFHLDCARDGLDHGDGYGWERATLVKQSCKFFETLDDPLGAMHGLLTERNKDRYTWVDALEDDVREALETTLNSSELVPLTRGASLELKGIIAKQRTKVAALYQRWMKAYQQRYGNREKRRERPTTVLRTPRNRH